MWRSGSDRSRTDKIDTFGGQVKRLSLGKKTVTNLYTFMKDNTISVTMKIRMYDCDSWILRKSERKKIAIFEICIWKQL